MRKKPRDEQFDNNYLYYLYCKWYIDENYDNAREYLYENIWQIVTNAKPKNIMVPHDLHYDLNMSMFMIVDDLYTQLFEDDSEHKIVDQRWNESIWTRFKKYYYPNQVYWLITLVVNKRIYTFFDELRKENNFANFLSYEDCLLEWWLWDTMDEMNTKIAYNHLIEAILRNEVSVSPVEYLCFILVYLKWESYEEVSRVVSSKWWIDQSAYKVKKNCKKVLRNIKENLSIDIVEMFKSI